tara:strand:+ start:937 stop:1188 length:252 start_codon:yes stop_codon:yes gene_type:complete
MGGKFGPIPKLKDKPLTKLLGPFFYGKWSKTTRIIIGKNGKKQPPLQNLVLGPFYEFGPVTFLVFMKMDSINIMDNGSWCHFL